MTFDEDSPSAELQRALNAYRSTMKTSREVLWTRVESQLLSRFPEDAPQAASATGGGRRARQLLAGASLVAAGFFIAVALQPTAHRSTETVRGPLPAPAGGDLSPTRAEWEARDATVSRELSHAIAAVEERLRATEHALAGSPNDAYLQRHLAALRSARSTLGRDHGRVGARL